MACTASKVPLFRTLAVSIDADDRGQRCKAPKPACRENSRRADEKMDFSDWEGVMQFSNFVVGPWICIPTGCSRSSAWR